MIASILIALSLILGFGAAQPAQAADNVSGMVACEFEDSTNCFWDAQTRGNGVGESFVDFDGVAYFACGEEDGANCFWDAAKRGNGEGRSFTDVNGTAIFWDEMGSIAGAWDAWDASSSASELTQGGRVTYSGVWDGAEIEYNQIEAAGYVFEVN